MAETPVPFVSTTIIPDRNAGIGSLLWDLQNPQDSDRDGPSLLDREFSFIDVGVSRAKVATVLKTMIASDLKMDVRYVATEHPDAVPYAYVFSPNHQTAAVRRSLTEMISKETPREVQDWHFVLDRHGKVSSVAYSYHFYGNEIRESYFMGRAFMYAGKNVDFSNPELDQALAHDVAEIEARIALERRRDGDPCLPAPDWDGYRLEKTPLEAALAECGIPLQQTDVPQRIRDRQNVLFLGNVLNNYPPDQQAGELARIATNMEQGDIVIVQVDEVEAAFIDVLKVEGHGDRKTLARVRWINTKTLEVKLPDPGSGSWRQIPVKPEIQRMAGRLWECIGMKVNSPEWLQENPGILARQLISHVFATLFRAMPVEQILRIAIREALRRLPSGSGLQGIPVFEGDAKDASGGALGLDPGPLLSQADFEYLARGKPVKEKPPQADLSKLQLEPQFSGEPRMKPGIKPWN